MPTARCFALTYDVTGKAYWHVRHREFDRHAGAAAYNDCFTSTPVVLSAKLRSVADGLPRPS
jgi:hypothetical protein